MNPHELIGKGYYLIPVRRSSDPKKDKAALLSNWPDLASRDPEQIAVWEKQFPGCNWGIVCKNCIVFDLDRIVNGRTLTEAELLRNWCDLTEDYMLQYPIVVTGNGGRHYYFRRPDEKIKAQTKFAYYKDGRKIETNIDIKVGNGYVVAPGCVNGKGGEYVCEDGLWAVDELPELPKEIIDILPKQTGEAPKPAVRTTAAGDIERKLYLCRLYAEKFDPAISGSRGHDQALRVSNAIFWGFDIPKEYGWPIFTEWNAKLVDPWSEKELEHKYSETMNKPPTGIARGSLYKPFDKIDDIYSKAAAALVNRLISADEKEYGAEVYTDENRSFPLEYFPKEIQDYCREVSKALCVDESFTGYLALSVTSAANGYRSTFSYRNYKRCRALFHTILVAYSGCGKSPTMEAMLFPVIEMDARSERKRVVAEKRYKEAKRNKKKNDPEPELPPFIPRQIVQGTTSEAIEKYWSDLEQSLIIDENSPIGIDSLDEELHEKISELKTGVLWWYDEGSALLQGMDAYKKAKSDQSVYIPILDGSCGGALRVDNDSNRRYFDSHTVLVAGIQDEVLKSIAKDDELYFQKGFFQRINFACPPFVPITREKHIISRDAKDRYRDKIIWMYDLEYHDFTLSPEAERIFEQFEEEADNDFNTRGYLGSRRTSGDSAIMSVDRKSTKRVLEVALLLEVMEAAGKDSIDKVITGRSMEGAIKIIQYCNDDFYKVVRDCCYSGGEQDRTTEDKIVYLLESSGENGMSVRELQQKVFYRQKSNEVIKFMDRMMRKYKPIRRYNETGKRGPSTFRYRYTAPVREPVEDEEAADVAAS